MPRPACCYSEPGAVEQITWAWFGQVSIGASAPSWCFSCANLGGQRYSSPSEFQSQRALVFCLLRLYAVFSLTEPLPVWTDLIRSICWTVDRGLGWIPHCCLRQWRALCQRCEVHTCKVLTLHEQTRYQQLTTCFLQEIDWMLISIWNNWVIYYILTQFNLSPFMQFRIINNANCSVCKVIDGAAFMWDLIFNMGNTGCIRCARALNHENTVKTRTALCSFW